MGRQARYHHGDLRRGLIDAALELVQQEGVGTLSLREVARRAGVSHAAPYRHFPSKEALLAAVAEEGFLDFGKALEAAAAGAGSSLQALQAIGVAYVEFALSQPAHFRVMFGAGSSAACDYPELAAASEGAYSVLVRTMQQNIDAGEVQDAPAAQLALVAWATVHGLAALLLDGMVQGAGAPDELARMVTGVLMAGLRSRPDSRT